MEGAVKATGVDSAAARSRGKLCAFLSCMTSIPRPALLRTSAQVLRMCPWLSMDRLVEVETIEVKRHGADAEGGKPDAHD